MEQCRPHQPYDDRSHGPNDRKDSDSFCSLVALGPGGDAQCGPDDPGDETDNEAGDRSARSEHEVSDQDAHHGTEAADESDQCEDASRLFHHRGRRARRSSRVRRIARLAGAILIAARRRRGAILWILGALRPLVLILVLRRVLFWRVLLRRVLLRLILRGRGAVLARLGWNGLGRRRILARRVLPVSLGRRLGVPGGGLRRLPGRRQRRALPGRGRRLLCLRRLLLPVLLVRYRLVAGRRGLLLLPIHWRCTHCYISFAHGSAGTVGVTSRRLIILAESFFLSMLSVKRKNFGKKKYRRSAPRAPAGARGGKPSEMFFSHGSITKEKNFGNKRTALRPSFFLSMLSVKRKNFGKKKGRPSGPLHPSECAKTTRFGFSVPCSLLPVPCALKWYLPHMFNKHPHRIG